MGFPQKSLGADERVVIHTRTHAKVLILPAVTLVLLSLATGFGAAVMPEGAGPIGQPVVALVGLALAIWWVVLPFLRWRDIPPECPNTFLRCWMMRVQKSAPARPLHC